MTTAILPSVAPAILNGKLDENFVFHISDAYTLAGFRKWVLSDEFPEKQPVMFLKGKIIFMPKENISTHAAIKTAVAGTVFNLNEEIDVGDFFINGVLVTNVEADVSNQPDMVGILSGEPGKR